MIIIIIDMSYIDTILVKTQFLVYNNQVCLKIK